MKKNKSKKAVAPSQGINKRLLIVANWKMNPTSLKEAKKIFDLVKKTKFNPKKTLPVICPPFVYLSELSNKYSGGNIKFGSQDVFWQKEGEFTGEISGQMIKDLKGEYVIVGHSERRIIGENDEMVALKLKFAISSGLRPILCVGEKERDSHAEYLRKVESQIRNSLANLTSKDLSKLVIAYEPVWAMGKGHTAMNSRELHQMNLYIKKILSDMFDKKIGFSVPVLYGGSVDAENCFEIVKEGEVDGLLIGRSSLNPHVFRDILKRF